MAIFIVNKIRSVCLFKLRNVTFCRFGIKFHEKKPFNII